MTAHVQHTTLQQLLALCGGDEGASDVILEMWALVEVWDDAVDREHNEPEDVINRAFLWSICGRDENPFLQRHPELRLAMKQMVAIWLAANTLERSKDLAQIRTAYTLRCSPYLFFVSVIVAAAGVPAGAQAAILLFGGEHGDSFEAYAAEHLGDRHGMGQQSTEA